jgi:hypothetical protein
MKLKDMSETIHGYSGKGRASFSFRRHNAALEIEIGGIREKLPEGLASNLGWIMCYALATALERFGGLDFGALGKSKLGLREEGANIIAGLPVADVMLLVWRRVMAKTRGKIPVKTACQCGEPITSASLGDMEVAGAEAVEFVEVEEEVMVSGNKSKKVPIMVPSFREVYCLMTEAEINNPAARVFRAVEASTPVSHESLMDMHTADFLDLARAVDAVSGGPCNAVDVACPKCGRDTTISLNWQECGFF